MKIKTIYMIIGLVAIAVVTAGTVIGMTFSNKPADQLAPSIMYLTANDNGTTVSVKKGDLVNLTLPDYGDGGYVWTITTIDNKMIRQNQHFTWGSSGMLGDFGKDTWIFTTIKTGSTIMGLECKRSWDPNDISQKLTFTIDIL